jgi:hypothetical protein
MNRRYSSSNRLALAMSARARSSDTPGRMLAAFDWIMDKRLEICNDRTAASGVVLFFPPRMSLYCPCRDLLDEHHRSLESTALHSVS